MPDYLKGRKKIIGFKTSWSFVHSSEGAAAKSIFFFLMLGMGLFTIFGIAMPFIASFTHVLDNITGEEA